MRCPCLGHALDTAGAEGGQQRRRDRVHRAGFGGVGADVPGFVEAVLPGAELFSQVQIGGERGLARPGLAARDFDARKAELLARFSAARRPDE